MCSGVEYFRPFLTVLVWRDIGIIPLYIERQPVRSATAAQRQSFLQDRSHWIRHVPNINVRIAPGAALPYFPLVGRPADSMQQSGIALRVLGNIRRDDLPC